MITITIKYDEDAEFTKSKLEACLCAPGKFLLIDESVVNLKDKAYIVLTLEEDLS